MRRALILTVAAASALAAPAAPAATWSAPQTVSTPHTFADPILTAPRGDGALVAAWRWQDSTIDDARGGESQALRPAAAGAPFGAEAPALDGLVAVGPYATARTLSLAAQGLPTRDRSGFFLSRLNVAFDDGTAPRTLATAPLYRAPALASAPGSTRALIAYVQPVKTSTGANRRIVRTIDRHDGAWSAPSTIAGTGRADDLAAAQAPDGTQVVAFARQGKVLARLRRPGHGWGSIRTLATSTPASRTTFTLQAAADPRGQVRVAWRRHVYRGALSLESAEVLHGRATFTAAQTVIADGAAAAFALVPAPGGWALATVQATADGPRPVLARTTLNHSPFGAAIAAAPAQGGLRDADAVAGPDGAVTVAWVQPLPGQDGDGQARAATLAAGAGAFGPVEDVSPPEAVHAIRLAAAGGEVTALWSARPEGTGPSVPIAQVRTYVRAASRTP